MFPIQAEDFEAARAADRQALRVPWHDRRNCSTAASGRWHIEVYLLGRLLALFPKVPPLALAAVTGVAYALVHLPDLWTTLVTIFGGGVWSWFYYRYRTLLPLACSHAALGSGFYYWVYGHDLTAEWGRLFQ